MHEYSGFVVKNEKFWIWWKEANELDETWCAITLLPYLDRKCMRVAIGRCTRALESKNYYYGVSETPPTSKCRLENDAEELLRPRRVLKS